MDNQKTYFWDSTTRGLAMVVLIMVVVALGAYAYAAVKEAKYQFGGPSTISVSGEGEVFAKPDIATFSFSVIAEGDDAATAQQRSAEAINEVIAFLEGEGIEERDIKTLYYNLNPRYEYLEAICNRQGFCPPGERVLKGYEVNQTIEVKVRNVENAGALISGIGTHGATNVSGLSFTIDEEDAILAEARELAIEDAKEKAGILADDLDVRLVRIMNYYEEGRGGPVFYNRAEGMGGEDMAVMSSPDVPVGENTFTSRVTITYEIR